MPLWNWYQGRRKNVCAWIHGNLADGITMQTKQQFAWMFLTIVVVVLVALFACGVYRKLAGSQNVAVARRGEHAARRIVVDILKMPPNVIEEKYGMRLQSSTDYFNMLYGCTIGMSDEEIAALENGDYASYCEIPPIGVSDAPHSRGFTDGHLAMQPWEFTCGVANDSKPRQQLKFENNYWIVASRIPSNAPANFIVLISANVDPVSLYGKLTPSDLHRPFRLKERKTQLGNLFIVGYHDACVYRKRYNPQDSKKNEILNLYEMYGHHTVTGSLQPGNNNTDFFDFSNDELPLEYLTPTGRVYSTFGEF